MERLPDIPATSRRPSVLHVLMQADVVAPVLMLLLAFAFMSWGLPPARVAAPMEQLLVFPPWKGHYSDVNPWFRGGDLLLQQLPWRHWMQDELAAWRPRLRRYRPLQGPPQA